MDVKRWISIAALVLVICGSGWAQRSSLAGGETGRSPDPLAEGQIFNIVDWDGGKLPQRYERSNQLPMSLEDVRKLSDNKFSESAIIRMIQQRRCACDASVDALIGLKEAGVAENVIQAVSLHGLAPNRALQLVISVDFEGLGGEQEISNQARKGYLYLIVPDGERERVFMGNLQAILAGRWQRDSLVDNTDLLMPKRVRRVVFAAEVPLKVHGKKRAMVFTSTKPDIYTSADIPEADREGMQTYEFDYPTSSLQRICDLQVLYRQDAMLQNSWHMVRSHFQCEWE
jgi:hypothetical protein